MLWPTAKLAAQRDHPQRIGERLDQRPAGGPLEPQALADYVKDHPPRMIQQNEKCKRAEVLRCMAQERKGKKKKDEIRFLPAVLRWKLASGRLPFADSLPLMPRISSES